MSRSLSGVMIAPLLIALAAGCGSAGSNELTREHAVDLLQAVVGTDFVQICEFGAFTTLGELQVAKEPEMASLKGDIGCTVEFVVTGIRLLSATEAAVDATLTVVYKEHTLKKWGRAIEDIQNRLANSVSVTKASQKVNSWTGEPGEGGSTRRGSTRPSTRWRISFPAGYIEQIECNRAVGRYRKDLQHWRDAGFRNFNHCKNAPKEEVYFHTSIARTLTKALKETKEPQRMQFSPEYRFQLYDDGWRVMKRW